MFNLHFLFCNLIFFAFVQAQVALYFVSDANGYNLELHVQGKSWNTMFLFFVQTYDLGAFVLFCFSGFFAYSPVFVTKLISTTYNFQRDRGNIVDDSSNYHSLSLTIKTV